MREMMNYGVLFLLILVCTVYSDSGVFEVRSWGEARAVPLIQVTMWVSRLLQGLPVVRIVYTRVHVDIVNLISSP
jgi:hypothetical protein